MKAKLKDVNMLDNRLTDSICPKTSQALHAPHTLPTNALQQIY